MRAGGGDATVAGPAPRRPARVIAGVLVAVVQAILFIVVFGFGKQLSFEHVIPVIADK